MVYGQYFLGIECCHLGFLSVKEMDSACSGGAAEWKCLPDSG
uniref:Uncharacterized protein n=1 Tax=Neisseria meningitidis alpha153 TaxID=663926 RepID=C6SF83_NEIME|nr:hypothetical protein predicted by Glimmer/Critica [Neisseria meningitidis alpha153]